MSFLKKTSKKQLSIAVAVAGCLCLATGCRESVDPQGGLRLVATTGQINDALSRITDGVDCSIKLFCGPGIDPHSFSASTKDVQSMEEADAIFFNGFHLEARLSDLLRERYVEEAWSMSSAFPKQHRLDWIEEGEVDPEAPFDPHIWNHLPAWAECVTALADRMAEIDPDNADIYVANGAAYVAEINETHEWAAELLSAIPEDRRILVSTHDAFNYFARVYDLETEAVLGIGNDPEADIQTMRSVAELVCDKKIPVIFMESITNPKVTTALREACEARGWNVSVATQRLYSDDLGEVAPQDTYLGAFRSNVELIVDSLAPQEAVSQAR